MKDKFKSVKLYDGNSDNGVIYDNKVLNQKELDRFLKKNRLINLFNSEQFCIFA